MKKSNKPYITDKELIIEVANRTGLPLNATFQAVYAYYDIVKECIANGVEVKMGELGTMKFKIKQPNKNVVYYNPKTKENLPPQDTPGFWVPIFTPRKKWRMELKEQTKFWEKENEGKKEVESEDGE